MFSVGEYFGVAEFSCIELNESSAVGLMLATNTDSFGGVGVFGFTAAGADSAANPAPKNEDAIPVSFAVCAAVNGVADGVVVTEGSIVDANGDGDGVEVPAVVVEVSGAAGGGTPCSISSADCLVDGVIVLGAAAAARSASTLACQASCSAFLAASLASRSALR